MLAFGGYLGWYAERFIRQPLRLLPPADVYVLHEFSTFPAVRWRATRCGGGWVYDAHDFYRGIADPAHATRLEREWLQGFNDWLENRCIAGARAVLTVSEGIAACIERQYGVRPTVVRNCHDSRLDRDPDRGLRERIGVGRDVFLLAAVGQRKPGQPLEHLFAALATLPPRVQLVLIGPGYEDILPRAACELPGRVHATGKVAPWEIVPLLREADAAIVPYVGNTQNLRACLPNGLFQGIAARLPVLYPPLPDIQALFAGTGCGIAVPMTEPAAIRASLEHVLQDPQAAGNVAARNALAERLEWQREEAVFVETVRRAMGAGAKGTAPLKGGKDPARCVE